MGAECLTVCFPGFVQSHIRRRKPFESFSTFSQPRNSWEPGLTTWEEEAYRASCRNIHPHPLLYTHSCCGSGVYSFVCCLDHSLNANSADRDPFVVSRIRSGSLFPEPHGCSFLAAYLDILDSKFITVSTLKSQLITVLSMLFFPPFTLFPMPLKDTYSGPDAHREEKSKNSSLSVHGPELL